MKTNEQLLIDYAENRTRLKVINNEISIYCDTEITGDRCLMEIITDCSKDYFDAEIDEYGCRGRWPGWDEILCDFAEGHPVCKLATMFDQRKGIKYEAGNITRAIAARGRALLRHSQ